jgi:hypothetical protein
MRIGQFSLDDFKVRKSKDFLKRIYLSDISGNRYFDVLKMPCMNRVHDEGMTLEKFLALSWRRRIIRLQIASPDVELIRYCASMDLNDGTTRFAWFEALFTDDNYLKMTDCLEKAYGLKFESFKRLGG